MPFKLNSKFELILKRVNKHDEFFRYKLHHNNENMKWSSIYSLYSELYTFTQAQETFSLNTVCGSCKLSYEHL